MARIHPLGSIGVPSDITPDVAIPSGTPKCTAETPAMGSDVVIGGRIRHDPSPHPQATDIVILVGPGTPSPHLRPIAMVIELPGPVDSNVVCVLTPADRVIAIDVASHFADVIIETLQGG